MTNVLEDGTSLEAYTRSFCSILRLRLLCEILALETREVQDSTRHYSEELDTKSKESESTELWTVFEIGISILQYICTVGNNQPQNRERHV